jgi:uracil-DNA glycosylase family 4
MRPRRINGHGPNHPKIAIVGEAPGAEEDAEGQNFVGRAGRMLNAILSETGLSREECYLTNVVKYRPPDNDLERLNEIGVSLSESEDELLDELVAVRPNIIVPVGGTALKALYGKDEITKYRGSLLSNKYGMKLLPTYHTSYLIRHDTPQYLSHVTVIDFLKVKRHCHSRDLVLPRRNLQVCRSSLDLHNFIQRARSSRILAIDIESHKCIPICVGFAYSKFDAISVPLFDNIGFKISDMSSRELLECWRLVAKILQDPHWLKVGQNLKYDQQKLNMIGLIIDQVYADTSHMMHTCYSELPLNIAFIASLLTDEPFWKDEGKDFNPKKDDIKRLLEYNAKDCAVEFECYEKLDSELRDLKQDQFYYTYVRRLHDFYSEIEKIGFAVDDEQRFVLQVKYEGLWQKHQAELNDLARQDLNVASQPQVAKFLYEDLKFRKLWKREKKAKGKKKIVERTLDTSEDAIVRLLNNHVKNESQERILRLILDIRRYRKTLGTYLNASLDYDGRMRCSYNICGTETGRTSTSKMKAPVRPKPIGIPYQVLTKHGSIGHDVRSILVADKGYILVETDLSQADARSVALLSNDDATLKAMEVLDLHRLTAALFYDLLKDIPTIEYLMSDPALIEEAEKRYQFINDDIRQVGKKGRHAGNYDMKKARLANEIAVDARRFGLNIKVSEYKAGKIINAFHAFSPKIKSDFHAQVDDYVKSNGYLINAFGRKRIFFDRRDEARKEWYAQIPQSNTTDHLRHGVFRLLDRGIELRILAETHDAICYQVRENEVEKILEEVDKTFKVPIDFSGCSLPRGTLVIPSESKVGYDYKNFQKFKPGMLASV